MKKKFPISTLEWLLSFVVGFVLVVVFLHAVLVTATILILPTITLQAPILISASALGYSGLLVLSMVLIYYLEATQQAANDVKSYDEDVILREVGDTKRKQHIEFIQHSYDALSAARQIASVFSILILKQLLEEASTTSKTILSAKYPQAASWISSDVILLVVSATLVAYCLQLFAKKVARKEPINFLSGVPLLLGRLLAQLGRIGANSPTLFLQFFYQRIFGVNLDDAKVYGPSSLAVLNEINAKTGYSVEELLVEIQLQPSKEVLLQRVRFSVENEPNYSVDDLRRIKHRMHIGGLWYTAEDEIKIKSSSATPCNLRLERVARSESEMVDYVGAEANEADEGATVEEEELQGERRVSTIFTIVATFLRNLKSPDHSPNFIDLSIPAYSSGEPQKGLAKRRYDFSLTYPVRSLKVRFISSTGSIPTGGTVAYAAAHEERNSNTVNMEAASDNACYAELRLPGVGSRISVTVEA